MVEDFLFVCLFVVVVLYLFQAFYNPLKQKLTVFGGTKIFSVLLNLRALFESNSLFDGYSKTDWCLKNVSWVPCVLALSHELVTNA